MKLSPHTPLRNPYLFCPGNRYIEHILIATHSGEAGVAEVFRALQNRLRDSTWTVVFKSLITVHLMIREGSPDATLDYLAKHRSMLSISNFTDGMFKHGIMEHEYCIDQGRAIHRQHANENALQYKHKDVTYDITRTIWSRERGPTRKLSVIL